MKVRLYHQNEEEMNLIGEMTAERIEEIERWCYEKFTTNRPPAGATWRLIREVNDARTE